MKAAARVRNPAQVDPFSVGPWRVRHGLGCRSAGPDPRVWERAPWGNTTQSGVQAGNNPYQYVSGYKDAATGYTKFGARYYNPAIGRFTQLDPSGKDPHYSYAGNNPITISDTSGLSFLSDVFDTSGPGIVGAVVSTVATVAFEGIKRTPLGAGASAGIGCASGAVTELVSGGSAGNVVGGCAVGAVGGLLPAAGSNIVRNITRNSDEIG